MMKRHNEPKMKPRSGALPETWESWRPDPGAVLEGTFLGYAGQRSALEGVKRIALVQRPDGTVSGVKLFGLLETSWDSKRPRRGSLVAVLVLDSSTYTVAVIGG